MYTIGKPRKYSVARLPHFPPTQRGTLGGMSSTIAIDTTTVVPATTSATINSASIFSWDGAHYNRLAYFLVGNTCLGVEWK